MITQEVYEQPISKEKRDFLLGFMDGLMPTERISVSDWANKYRILSNVASARPGPYDIMATPYLKEISDCLTETSSIEEVIFMKGAQIGATEVGNNWIGYIIHIAPSSTLMIMPTDTTVRTNSQIRIDPMIQDSPVLRKRVMPAGSKKSRNTTLQKAFPMGVLLFAGANSPVGFRSLPIRNVMLDELDGYPANIGGEGSATKLAKARTSTYSDKGRKTYMVSTPKIKGKSAIEREYNNSDQRKYYVPCPHCGTFQTIEWERIKWESDDKPETAYLECEHCHEAISEDYKFNMIKMGHWEAQNPTHPNKKRRGYHISALYSTLGYKWKDAVTDYLDGKKNMADMIAFVNTVLGLGWADVTDVPDWENLYNRREGYRRNVVPKDVAFLTAGVDIQRDRIELEIVGWCKNKVSYSIDYRVLPGDTSASDVWDMLDRVINETWERSDGAIMPLRMMAIDASYNTTEVYTFCRKYDINKVVAVRGKDEQMSIYSRPLSVDVSQGGKVVDTIKYYNVGVSMVKSELYGWLRQFKLDGKAEPIGYCHFPEYDDKYFKMLTAERKELTKDKRGRDVYAWVLPDHTRNEALDCRVYARCAAAIIQMDRFTNEDWEIQAASYPLKDDINNPHKPTDDNKDDDYDDYFGGRGGRNFL